MSLDLHLLTNLVTLNCASAGIAGTLDLHGITTLTTVDCSGNSSLTGVTLTGCTGITTLFCQNCSISALTGLGTCSSMVTLRAFTNHIVTLNCTGLSNLAELIGGNDAFLTTVNVTGCSSLGDFDFTDSPNFANFLGLADLVSCNVDYTASNCPLLTTLSFPNLVAFTGVSGHFIFSACTGLTSISIPNLVFSDNGGNVEIIGAALDQASVDGILARLVASGVTTMVIDLSGGTNALPTDCTNVNILVTAGNVVATNRVCP